MNQNKDCELCKREIQYTYDFCKNCDKVLCQECYHTYTMTTNDKQVCLFCYIDDNRVIRLINEFKEKIKKFYSKLKSDFSRYKHL